MRSQLPYSHYYLVVLTLVIVLAQNAHQVLCNQDDVIERAIPVMQLDRLPLPPNAVGPVNIDFDHTGVGPYTGVSNGRILKWFGPSTGFLEFAVTSQDGLRQECKSKDPNLEPVCGRPLVIGFYKKTGTLYVSDAYKGLRSIGSNSGVATLVASSAEGIPFNFTSGLNIDQDNGVIYFTDASARFQLRDLDQAIVNGDMSGRLIRYDIVSKQVTVLLRGLGLAADAAISKDRKFVLVSEFLNSRILRYWLKGPKANTTDVFFALPAGRPTDIKRNTNGDFWVAFSTGTLQDATPLGILLGENGKVIRTLNFTTANVSVLITCVKEFNRKLYVGSLSLDYVGVTRTTRG